MNNQPDNNRLCVICHKPNTVLVINGHPVHVLCYDKWVSEYLCSEYDFYGENHPFVDPQPINPNEY